MRTRSARDSTTLAAPAEAPSIAGSVRGIDPPAVSTTSRDGSNAGSTSAARACASSPTKRARPTTNARPTGRGTRYTRAAAALDVGSTPVACSPGASSGCRATAWATAPVSRQAGERGGVRRLVHLPRQRHRGPREQAHRVGVEAAEPGPRKAGRRRAVEPRGEVAPRLDREAGRVTGDAPGVGRASRGANEAVAPDERARAVPCRQFGHRRAERIKEPGRRGVEVASGEKTVAHCKERDDRDRRRPGALTSERGDHGESREDADHRRRERLRGGPGERLAPRHVARRQEPRREPLGRPAERERERRRPRRERD